MAAKILRPPPASVLPPEAARLDALVDGAARRAIQANRDYAATLAAANRLVGDARQPYVIQRAVAVNNLLARAAGVMKSCRDALAGAVGTIRISYRDGSHEEATILAVEADRLRIRLADGSEVPVGCGTLHVDFVSDWAQRKTKPSECDLASLALCDGDARAMMRRLFVDGSLRDDAFQTADALVESVEAARHLGFISDADVAEFVRSVEGVPGARRAGLAALVTAAGLRSAADMRREIETSVGAGRHADAVGQLTSMLRRHPADAETLKAASAAYSSLMSLNWKPAWNGRDLSEFRPSQAQGAGVAGDVLSASYAGTTAALPFVDLPLATGLSLELRMRRWSATRGAGFTYTDEGDGTQRAWIVGRNVMNLIVRDRGAVDVKKTLRVRSPEITMDQWVTLTLVVLGDHALYFLDGQVIHRAPAAEVRIDRYSGLEIAECIAEYRNIRVRLAK
jgi:hypothetical protein